MNTFLYVNVIGTHDIHDVSITNSQHTTTHFKKSFGSRKRNMILMPHSCP